MPAPTSGAAPRLHVAGLGPAGAILALRARQRGWRVTAWDPRVPAPGRLPEWPATYGALVPELPGWAREFFTPAHELRVVAESRRTLPYRYTMLDKESLRAAVESCGARIRPGRAPQGAAPLVQCTGAPAGPGTVWQVAVGLVLPSSLPDATTDPTFMNWELDTPFPPSFLYVQPVEDGMLWEETVLASKSKPDELYEELERRLRDRLGSTGESAVRRELVAIPMGTRRREPSGRGRYVFGAAAGLTNPATGYSVGASCARADALLDRIASERSWTQATELGLKNSNELPGPLTSDGRSAENIRGKCDNGRRSTGRVLARVNAELAWRLRALGAELICRADHATLRSFFDAFFQLDGERQLAYLTSQDGIGVARTMWALRGLTGFGHPFLRPLWREPIGVLRSGRS